MFGYETFKLTISFENKISNTQKLKERVIRGKSEIKEE